MQTLFWMQKYVGPAVLRDIKWCEQAVSAPDSCLGDIRFKSLPGDWLSSLKFFVVFLRPSRHAGIVP
jgi:hypothetical protein